MKGKVDTAKFIWADKTFTQAMAAVKQAIARVKVPMATVKQALACVTVPMATVKLAIARVKVPMAAVKLALARVTVPMTAVKLALARVTVPMAAVKLAIARVTVPMTAVKQALARVTVPMTAVKLALEAKQGDVSGSVKLIARSQGRASYQWQKSSDGIVFTNLPSTLQAKTMANGFAPGVAMYFRCRPVTKSGEGDWTSVVSLTVL